LSALSTMLLSIRRSYTEPNIAQQSKMYIERCFPTNADYSANHWE